MANTYDKSSYLRFLPPILWQAEPDAPQFSLGSALRVFEKILTGIDDGVVIEHRAEDGTLRRSEPLAHVIGNLHRLYNPWTTPPDFLRWLASWTSLELPAKGDEYQQRRVAAEITGIYRKRGLKRGLDEYLDLYSVSDKRPRIAIDDGGRLMSTRPVAGRFAPIDCVIGHGPVSRRDGSLLHGGLVRPQCIARAPDGTLIVGDAGTPTGWRPVVAPAVWAVSPPGRYGLDNRRTRAPGDRKEPLGGPAYPKPLGPSPWDAQNPNAPRFPMAVAVDNEVPWRVYVLDHVSRAAAALYRLPSPTFGPVVKVAKNPDLKTDNPVAMAFDARGHLLILDRGGPHPKIIDIQIAPLVCTEHKLAKVIEPLSLLVLNAGPGGGDLVIGDGGRRHLSTPGDLVHVSRADPALWDETRMLATPRGRVNPLVAPTGVIEFDNNRLLVLDSGLKPATGSGSRFIRAIAEPAALYWVGRTPSPTVARASELQSLVSPRGLVFDGENAFICDPGEPEGGVATRVSRALPHEFTVIVHFRQGSTRPPERSKIRGNIRDIVDLGKPAHTLWTMLS